MGLSFLSLRTRARNRRRSLALLDVKGLALVAIGTSRAEDQAAVPRRRGVRAFPAGRKASAGRCVVLTMRRQNKLTSGQRSFRLVVVTASKISSFVFITTDRMCDRLAQRLAAISKARVARSLPHTPSLFPVVLQDRHRCPALRAPIAAAAIHVNDALCMAQRLRETGTRRNLESG